MDHRRAFVGCLVVAGACAPFGGAADVGSDAGPADGSTTETTPSDDGGGTRDPDAAVLDGGGSPCRAAHFLCEDFDGPLPWAGWIQENEKGSPIQRGTTRFVSAPASLHVTVQPDPNKSNHPSFLHRKLPAAQRIVVTADIAVTASTSPAANGEIDVIALELDKPDGFDRYFVTVVAKSDGRYVLETDVRRAGANVLAGPETIGNLGPEFQRIVLDLDLDKGKVTAGFDGTVPTTIPLTSATGVGARFEIGAAWASNSTGTFSVDIDNVIVDQ